MTNNKNIEVEVRALLDNSRLIERNLLRLGAKFIKKTSVKDSWFCDSRINDYHKASIDRTGYALRIREISKGKKKTFSLECKTLSDGFTHALCNEYSSAVNDPLQIEKILESIGLKKFLVLVKERRVYILHDLEFSFDRIPGVGQGLEVEAIVSKQEEKRKHREILKLASSLGVKQRNILKKSLTYLAMKKLSRF
ncbi:MAG: class IV adenylate cyclase [Patescibacteria group bacterium]|nr:class IV adenylate cyclase [Patescibacteria group bacterium]